ncbi:hypothetical protein ACFOG5_10105 [Pedobacter fastidiosus]|uniref:DUF2116 family Zn-ribbon domain-containing protein n=1 Tax=Pedobacter fastidiosus TaxID=2765361 RepID=A0ABR7KWB4_9SPHI|nr:hypothetical protein [Pedobacter fastidiosus]MBC6112410.1 hypothetical protein [Pedobacter fastidiosus]
MERLCLDCGKPVKGRTDKKFCDDLCRNSYNNRLKSEDSLVVKRINLILKKNRNILAKFNPEGKAKITRKKLFAAGFNLDYHTHIHQTSNGNNYSFCYEYGYLILNEEEFLLVKREEK